MPGSRRPLIAAGLLVLALTGAALPSAPLYLPTRDVTVSYDVAATANGLRPPSHVRVAIAAGGSAARIEAATLPFTLIVDRVHARVIMLLSAAHAYAFIPGGIAQADAYLPTQRARFSAQGSERIAGHACTDWRMTDPGSEATACITPDGVILRAAWRGGGRTARLLATSVDYGVLPRRLFAPPAGFQRLNLPPGLVLPRVR